MYVVSLVTSSQGFIQREGNQQEQSIDGCCDFVFLSKVAWSESRGRGGSNLADAGAAKGVLSHAAAQRLEPQIDLGLWLLDAHFAVRGQATQLVWLRGRALGPLHPQGLKRLEQKHTFLISFAKNIKFRLT
jgi:hypothetical protein